MATKALSYIAPLPAASEFTFQHLGGFSCPRGCDTRGGFLGFFEDTVQGDITCKSCATVCGQYVDPGEEVRHFADDTEDKSRVALENAFLQHSLGTRVDKGSAGELGRAQDKLMSLADKNTLAAAEKIDTLSHLLAVPERIQTRAKQLYAELETKRGKGVRGFRTDGYVAVVLFLACRQEGYPRSFREVSRETGLPEEELHKHFKTISKLLPSTARAPSADAGALVNRLGSQLGLPYRVIQIAAHVAFAAGKLLEGRLPDSIATACVLLVLRSGNGSHAEVTEEQLASLGGVSSATVRAVYRLLLPHKVGC
jgi:transcription initiation factor TFIIB